MASVQNPFTYVLGLTCLSPTKNDDQKEEISVDGVLGRYNYTSVQKSDINTANNHAPKIVVGKVGTKSLNYLPTEYGTSRVTVNMDDRDVFEIAGFADSDEDKVPKPMNLFTRAEKPAEQEKPAVKPLETITEKPSATEKAEPSAEEKADFIVEQPIPPKKKTEEKPVEEKKEISVVEEIISAKVPVVEKIGESVIVSRTSVESIANFEFED